MSLIATIMHHPRKLFLRRALFQVHLWLGIFLSVYVALIGLSGSALVFEEEMRAHSLRDLHADPAHLADPLTVLHAAATAYPNEKPTYLMWPSEATPAYTLYLRGGAEKSRSVLADAADGHLLTAHPRLLMDTVHEFHVYLLMGHTGFVLNCVAGIGLLVLALTGAVLWWPGVRLWLRGLRIHWRGSWKRINYDSHNVIGILTLGIVSFWGFTSIDFLWPAQTQKAVALVSPLRGMLEPVAPKIAKANGPVNASAVLRTVMQGVHTLHPAGSLSGIALPALKGGNIVAYVDTGTPGDFSHRDIHTFDGTTGTLLTTWHYGQNQTLGDWILWLVYPLHFGTLWGMPVKIVWCLLGLSLPVLSVTGLLMYWNRYLSKRWQRLTA